MDCEPGETNDTNSGRTGLISAVAVTCSALLTWSWIGVKHIILILWELSLLGFVALTCWTLLTGMRGFVLILWILLLVRLALLTF